MRVEAEGVGEKVRKKRRIRRRISKHGEHIRVCHDDDDDDDEDERSGQDK